MNIQYNLLKVKTFLRRVPTATPESQASEQGTGVEETPVESKKKGTPGFEFVLSAVVISMLYLFVRSRR